MASPKIWLPEPAASAGQAFGRADAPASVPGPAAGLRRAVFLHGLWRSGSTYVWSRFRAAEASLCYYEPLHDGLGRLTRARIERDTPDMVLANRHPALAQPYFTEFAPLIASRGVRGHRRRFAYKRFAPAVGEDDPPLEAYIQGLIGHARRQGRTPVLGCNRTGLRVGWLKARFDACHVHIDRDPIDVFSSYLAQMQAGNYYYFVKWMEILASNAEYPLFARAAARLPRQDVVQRLLVRSRHFYRSVAQEASMEALYALTFLAWAAYALHGLMHSDVILDVAAERPGYGERVAEQVRAETGLSVSFEEMHAPSPPSPLRLARQRAIEGQVLADIAAQAPEGLFDWDRIRSRLGELSPRRAELLARIA